MVDQSSTSYEAIALRTRADELQRLLDILREANPRRPPSKWTGDTEMAIWALRIAAAVVDHVDRSMVAALDEGGMAVDGATFSDMRAGALTEFLQTAEPSQG